jgi:hypothetical protein
MFGKIAATLAIAALSAGLVLTHGTANANASSRTLQTVSKSETIVNSKCYTYRQVTTTYYHYSTKVGWELYASPKRTVTTGETCHA